MLKYKDNYYKELKNKNPMVFILYYYSIINEFYNIIKKKKMDINIFLYGINSIHHIFNYLLLYTKNIFLTITYSKNAFIYYIEFIEQINNKNNLFLKLKKEDATLFVYKKTIFNIEKKYFINNKKNDIFNYIYKFTNLTNLLIRKKVLSDDGYIDFYKNIKKKIKEIHSTNINSGNNYLNNGNFLKEISISYNLNDITISHN